MKMKNLFKVALAVCCFMMATSLSAQKAPKFGHIDFANLYSLMPGQDTVQAKYQEYGKMLKGQLDAMQNELQSKAADYQANVASMSDLIKATKEKELQDLNQRIQDFQGSAQQSLQKKEEELTTPIIDRAKKAVKDVAKDGGYTYIFNSAEGLLLFAEPSDDILPLVKKKLGIN